MTKSAGFTLAPALAGAGAAVLLGVVLYAAGIIGTPRQSSAPAEADPVALAAPLPAETDDEAAGETVAETPEEPAETPVPQAEPAPDPEPETAAAPASPPPRPPSIDTFRLEPDGAMLVAGQADPAWHTFITLDGEKIDPVTPDASGQFVAFLNLEPTDKPRVLSLVSHDPEGDARVMSRDEIILAPTPATQLALAEPEEAGTATEAAEPAETTLEVSADAPPQDDTAAATATADNPVDPEPAEQMAARPEPEPEPATSTADPEPSQTVLLADESGVRVLQPATPSDAAPDVMSSVALDAITYSEAGEVELSGRGLQEGFVRIYLDNAPVTTSRVSQTGNWRADLPDVDTGVYTLRIDETDAEGNVTSRVETPFKREDEAVVTRASAEVQTQRVKAVTVQPGSTLWAISRETYGEGVLYVRVFEANRDRIRNPDLIYPGQVFSLPE